MLTDYELLKLPLAAQSEEPMANAVEKLSNRVIMRIVAHLQQSCAVSMSELRLRSIHLHLLRSQLRWE